MFLGTVLGPVESTVKHGAYAGRTLLLVRPEGAFSRVSAGDAVLAVDLVQAGEGDRVLVCVEGASAIDALGQGPVPVDAIVVGVVDHIAEVA